MRSSSLDRACAWAEASANAWSMRSFSTVHFSMFAVSVCLSDLMYSAARVRTVPLFKTPRVLIGELASGVADGELQPGTIPARVWIPSLMACLRLRSTSFWICAKDQVRLQRQNRVRQNRKVSIDASRGCHVAADRREPGTSQRAGADETRHLHDWRVANFPKFHLGRGSAAKGSIDPAHARGYPARVDLDPVQAKVLGRRLGPRDQ